jgi:hypothetical protein
MKADDPGDPLVIDPNEADGPAISRHVPRQVRPNGPGLGVQTGDRQEFLKVVVFVEDPKGGSDGLTVVTPPLGQSDGRSDLVKGEQGATQKTRLLTRNDEARRRLNGLSRRGVPRLDPGRPVGRMG